MTRRFIAIPRTILHATLNILHATLNILHATLNILHATLNILHVTRIIFYLTRNIFDVPRRILHLPRNILQLSRTILPDTRLIFCATRHILRVTRVISPLPCDLTLCSRNPRFRCRAYSLRRYALWGDCPRVKHAALTFCGRDSFLTRYCLIFVDWQDAFCSSHLHPLRPSPFLPAEAFMSHLLLIPVLQVCFRSCGPCIKGWYKGKTKKGNILWDMGYFNLFLRVRGRV